MQPFDYIIPKDHAEASVLLANGNGFTRAFQGGTDLMNPHAGRPREARAHRRTKSIPRIQESGNARKAGW